MNTDTLKAWVQASRPPFFIATLVPVTIGWILGAKDSAWRPGRFFLVVFGSFLVHLATNLANDYFDHILGADAGESIGGSRVIQEGKITPASLRGALFILYGLASMVAVYLMSTLHLWAMLPLILLALFSSIFYVAPPIRYGYHGLGEVFVGVNMGPVMMLGTYWVIAGRPDWKALYVSLPVGLMVAAILYYQNLPDLKTDQASGKRTLAVRLGKKNAFVGFIVLWGLIYLSILALILSRHLPWPAIASLLSIPIVVKVLKLVNGTRNWVELDQYGKYVRMLYFFIGSVMIVSLLL
ncbi:MAG: 1,4-dihydroxy-2-naphthoate octaprenyltransferase [Desulfobacterales bacterium]|nr:1,4-dihydroxy-2-naphthoate octaprenyltransferase [Desulfobacterales bacterium]